MEQKVVRRRGACSQCKHRKIRCVGHPTCGRCLKQSLPCQYLSPRPTRNQHSKSFSPASDSPNSDDRNQKVDLKEAECSYPPDEATNSVDLDLLSQPFTSHNDLTGITTDFPEGFGFLDEIAFSSLDHDLLAPEDDYQYWVQDLGLDTENPCGKEIVNAFPGAKKEDYKYWLQDLDLTVDNHSGNENDTAFPNGLFPSQCFAYLGPGSVPSKDETENTGQDGLSVLENTFISNMHTISSKVQNPDIQPILKEITGKIFGVSKSSSSSMDENTTTLGPNYEPHITRKYSEAYFDKFQSRYPLMVKSEFQSCIDCVIASQDQAKDTAIAVIVNTVLAVGCSVSTPRIDAQAQIYMDAALRSRESLMRGLASVQKIQALIMLAIFVERTSNSATAMSLISLAAQYSFDLKLNRMTGIRALTKDPQQQFLFQRIFWCIYSIEKPLAMRLGRSSIIDEDFIDLSPHSMYGSPAAIQPQYNELLGCCEFAKLCSIVMKRLNAVQSPVINPTSRSSTASSLELMVETWKTSVLKRFEIRVDLQEGSVNIDWNMSPDPYRFLELNLLCHELRFMIHQSGETCIRTSREILAMAHLFELNRSTASWSLVQLPIMACCYLLHDIFCPIPSQQNQQDLIHMGSAVGWFARLSGESSRDFAFQELIQLIYLAQKCCSFKQVEEVVMKE